MHNKLCHLMVTFVTFKWYEVFYYKENLSINWMTLVNVYFVGLNLAVFRDDNGNAYILDAYCPHLGANIAIGGHVIGDCLECPFHGWQFRGSDGKVTKIPYSESSTYSLMYSFSR